MRQLIGHSLAYFLARGGSAGFNFIALFIFTRLLAPKDYGQYAVFIAVVSTGSTMLFGWLKLSVLRFWSEGKRRSELVEAISHAFKVLSLGSLFLAGLAYFVIPSVAPSNTAIEMRQWVALIYLSVLVLALYELQYETLRANLNPLAVLAVVVVRGTLFLILGSVLVLVGFTAFAPALGQLVGLAVAVGIVWRFTPLRFDPRRGARLSRMARQLLFGELIPYGLPLSMSLFGAALVVYTDRLMIAYFKGSAEAGIYAASSELANGVINLPMSALALASFPLMVRALSKSSDGEISKLAHINFSMLMFVGVPVAAIVVLYSDVVSSALGANYKNTASSILPLMAVAVFLNAIRMYHYDRAFHFSKKTIFLAGIMIIVALANFLLNFALVPTLGLEGAVYASIVAYAIALAMSIAVGRMQFVLVGSPSAAILAVLLTISAFAILNTPFIADWNRGLQAILFGVAYALFYFVYRQIARYRNGLDR